MSRTLRTLAALALTVLFLTSPVAAAARPGQTGAALWTSAWEWLLNILPGDPSGGGPLQGAGPDGDAGVTIDPDGVAVSGADSERGREVRQDR